MSIPASPLLVNTSPVTFLLWYPTAIIRCRCKERAEDQSVLALIGIGTQIKCPYCPNIFMIQGINADQTVQLAMSKAVAEIQQ